MKHGVAGILIFLIFLGLSPSLLQPLMPEDYRAGFADRAQNLLSELRASVNAGPDDNSASVRSNTHHKRDLGIVKSHVGNFAVGQTGTYSIVVTNVAGEALGKNVKITVTDSLPDGLAFNKVNAPEWTCNSTARVTCTYRTSIAGLAAGASLPTITLTVNVLAAAAPDVTNVARVWVPGDANLSNNVSRDPTLVPSADLGVTKSIDTASPSTGDKVEYTLTVANYGPSQATNVRLTDALPAGLIYFSHAASRGSYDPAAGLWTIDSLAKDARATLNLQMYVDLATPAGTVIVNTAGDLVSDQADPHLSNNSAGAELTVSAPAALSLDFFKARPQAPGSIQLEWGTLFETNTFGFNLYRSLQKGGFYTRLNASLIPAAAPGSPQGSAYTFIDRTAAPGITYYYLLEFVDLSQKPSLQGMLSITYYAVFMPVIAR